jgi:division protein CdvB (Snf7/Vps24/ESCRT-III family)
LVFRTKQNKVEQRVAGVMKAIEAEYSYWTQEREKANEDLEAGRRANDGHRAARAEQRIARIEDRRRQINNIMGLLQTLKDNIRFTQGTIEKYREIGNIVGKEGANAEIREHLAGVTEDLQVLTESQAKLESQMDMALAISRAPLATAPAAAAPESAASALDLDRENEELQKRLRKSRGPS